MANGILAAGTGVGVLVMAPIVEILCEVYGWKGALLIHSAINAHRVVCAQLLMPSAAEKRAMRKNRIARTKRWRRDTADNTNVYEMIDGSVTGSRPQDEFFLDDCATGQNSDGYCVITSDKQSEDAILSNASKVLIHEMSRVGPGEKEGRMVSEGKGGEVLLIEEREDFEPESNTSRKLEYGPETEELAERTTADKKSTSPVIELSFCSIYGYLLGGIRESFDLKLLLDPGFSIFLASFFATSASSIASRYYIPSKLVFDLGIPRLQATLSMTLLGACNTIIRALHGLLLDYRVMSLSNLYILGTLLTGISMILNPFAESFTGQMVLIAVYGVGDGLVIPLTMIMIKKLVKPEKLPNAVGIRFAVGGIAVFVGVLSMGRLYDVTGSYDVSFFFVGGVQLLGVALIVFLTKCSKWRPGGTQ